MKTKGKSGVMDMTQGNMAMLILSFALPLMLGNVFQQFYTVADTAIVGKILGVDALAALGTVESINWLVLGTIQGITQGFGILVSQQFGAKKEEALRCVQLRKHSKAREKRYSFGYAVSFIFACYQILWTFPKSRYLCSRYLPLVCG